MRHIFSGALILGLGLLFALPFRKPSSESIGESGGDSNEHRSNSSRPMDLNEIDLLVREVTDGVEIPVLFQAMTDHSAKPPAKQINTVPLKYEDVAVPVGADPFYAERFNATAKVTGRQARDATVRSMAKNTKAMAKNTKATNIRESEATANSDASDRVEKLRMRFANKRSSDASGGQNAGSLSTPAPLTARRRPLRLGTGRNGASPQKATAQLASSAAEPGIEPPRAATADRLRNSNAAKEVSRNAGTDQSILSPLPVLEATDTNRSPQWIRQPD